MNVEDIKQRLIDALNPENEEAHVALASALDVILGRMESIGLVVVPDMPMTATDLHGFVQTILEWTTNPEATTPDVPIEIEFDDINGEAILYALRQKGWIISPPQS